MITLKHKVAASELPPPSRHWQREDDGRLRDPSVSVPVKLRSKNTTALAAEYLRLGVKSVSGDVNAWSGCDREAYTPITPAPML